MKVTRTVTLTLVLALAVFGLVAATQPAGGIIGLNAITTPPITTSTTTSYTATSTYTSTSSTTTTSTSFSTSSTTTTTTSTSTSWSYTTTVSTTSTSTSISTTYSSTFTYPSTSTFALPTTTTSTTSTTSVQTIHEVGGCPVAMATDGTSLQPYADVLRNFRNTDIQNTTAGRAFMLTFNSWYYSWAPSLTYEAASNPLVFDAVRFGVYPLIGVLYASYGAYLATAPLSPEIGAISAGIVAASLIGLVYLGPVLYISSRIIRRRIHAVTGRRFTLPTLAWLMASLCMIAVAYLTSSTELLAAGTSGMVLSMLGLGSFIGTRVAAYVQVPFAYMNTLVAFKLGRRPYFN